MLAILDTSINNEINDLIIREIITDNSFDFNYLINSDGYEEYWIEYETGYIQLTTNVFCVGKIFSYRIISYAIGSEEPEYHNINYDMITTTYYSSILIPYFLIESFIDKNNFPIPPSI